MTQGYSRTQIALHWGILVLLAAQFLFNETISDAWEKIGEGGEAGFSPMIAQHVVTGVLILVLLIWRVALRMRRGVPEGPAEEPAILKFVARATHGLLYLLLLLMPVSGLVAWFGRVEQAAAGHEVMKVLLLVIVGLHILGALYQQYVLKSDVLGRMTRPEA